MSIKESLDAIKKSLPNNVTLVAVSKTKPAVDVQTAYDLGQRHFGENKIKEMCQKQDVLPKDIYWHMIGHVQTNKVKFMIPFVHLIHSVDSLKLLKEINRQAEKHQRVVSCLLQQHISSEKTKFGLDEKEIRYILDNETKKLKNVNIVGLMGMASFVNDQTQILEEFKSLKVNLDFLKNTHKDLTILSMGMSGDYLLALEQGSTMVRIGSTIFGNRNN